MNTVPRNFIVGLLLTFSMQFILAQNITLQRVEPPNWWVGMENTQLQLLVYGENISSATPSIAYNGVSIKSVSRLESSNYLFINLTISKQTKPGTFEITFRTDKNKKLVYKYELIAKRNRNVEELTIDGSDVMYLITPDRFSNGDPTNDSTDDTIERADRKNPNGRHGGDIKGIINHLDYIENLGVTTLWLNPFLENDQSAYSYHGYGISDFYKTDSRLGTNNDYKTLINFCHARGLKVVMDQVFNHCGTGHWWMNDLPSQDWLNQWDEFTYSSFTNATVSDPYQSKSDYDLHAKGWFDVNLPDLNLNNPYLANYLIQNSIWWIEYANLDGIRMDTYPYPNNKEVMADWLKTIEEEYPNYYVVAETAMGDKVASYVYWNNGRLNRDGYVSNIKSISDYALYYSMIKVFGKDENIYDLYEILSSDYLYENPFNNKIFNGNHDVARLYTELKKNKDKVKLSMAFIFTTRGIPQVYYGDELFFDSPKPDGILRYDFPGGWESDQRNAFLEEERTTDEKDLIEYISTILKWRKEAMEIHQGKLKHYKPMDNIYVYFRYYRDEKTMVVINNNEQSKILNLSRFKESLQGFAMGLDIIKKRSIALNEEIVIDANTALIVKLKK
ncbi:alpha-amylase family glycosyl hydrolase [Tamlana sp. 2201CG12-4]|uniref:alpha-amylase family glycosyl hydrolase n=1 Tax=Tamlana sp. 2201CG12-4 TaxID=3112582 RepID=UPI002DB8E08F|nr:alpha-amylase family glycosyl hydrolase [Tamlana sp. 2201CG12-4]MEC3908884.1 alpha-amylase family glycosyl hydrolase [Tamlana sp. 2201CG12-4]